MHGSCALFMYRWSLLCFVFVLFLHVGLNRVLNSKLGLDSFS